MLWAARSFGGFRHPRDMGQAEVESFLTMLATEKQVSPATHRQALNALLFLYRQVLGIELPWMQQIGGHCEIRVCPHLASLVCHPFATSRYRHPNGAGVAGALRRVHDHDLHACAEGGGGWHGHLHTPVVSGA